MARYIGPVCRFCRRESVKLFLKGDRCYTDKCSFDRNQYPPGQHGQARLRVSEYGTQLREKQKVKRVYGLLERQFRRYFHEAERLRGVTGENLLVLLESRLDNVVYRVGFAGTRAEARQLVRHGHILVNGRRLDIPSAHIKPGDVVSVKESMRQNVRIVDALEKAVNRAAMSWLEVDRTAMAAKLSQRPVRSEITLPIQENLVVELYSR